MGGAGRGKLDPAHIESLRATSPLGELLAAALDVRNRPRDQIRERIEQASDELMARKAARFGPELMRAVEKQILLQTLDHLWREHLATLDHLRSVIGFRGYAQRDPLNEYKTEAFELFQTLLGSLRRAVTGQLAHVEIQQRPAAPGGVAMAKDPLQA